MVVLRQPGHHQLGFSAASLEIDNGRQLDRATCAYQLCHPNVVPMETAEPSD